MPLLNNQNLQTPHTFDLETKLFQPTAILFEQLSLQTNQLWQGVQDALISAHTAIASAAMQVYEQPQTTLTLWYEQMLAASKEKYTYWVDYITPKAEQFYDDTASSMNQFGAKSVQFFQDFQANPQAAASDIYTRIVSYLQYFYNTLVNTINSGYEATQSFLLSAYYTLAETVMQLLDTPEATLKSLYYTGVNELLEVYANSISWLLNLF